jgi:hypothetical protein
VVVERKRERGRREKKNKKEERVESDGSERVKEIFYGCVKGKKKLKFKK